MRIKYDQEEREVMVVLVFKYLGTIFKVLASSFTQLIYEVSKLGD